MKTLTAHKIRLVPNKSQEIYFKKACGCARKAYNWGLDNWNKSYEAEKLKKSLNPAYQIKNIKENELRKEFNKIKYKEYPYMLEVTKCAPQLAIKNLGKAFSNFFKGQSGYPQFKKKGISDSFQISNDQFRIDGKTIKIPNLGWVKMRESLRFNGKIMNATVSRRANQWFVSICVEMELDELVAKLPKRKTSKKDKQEIIGIDLGIKHLATLSNGIIYENPKALNKLLHRVKLLSKRLNKKQLKSKNRDKARQKLAKVHLKVSNQRADCLHKLTTELTTNYNKIIIEDLNVQGMLKNHKLARNIADVGFYEFKRQLQYKAALRGNEIVLANRFFPSSKLCSVCGHKNDQLQLKDRVWTCICGANHDRDINAAINLKDYHKHTGYHKVTGLIDDKNIVNIKIKKSKKEKVVLPLV